MIMKTERNPGAVTHTRRYLLAKIGGALNAIAAVLIGIPLVGFIFSSFTAREDNSWISLGPIDQFPEGQTRLAVYQNPSARPWDGDTAKVPCWVRRIQGEQFQVFAINCTHLGCPVRWFPGSSLFLCPCHGGVFYADGTHAAGPPPRGLYQYQLKIADGNLLVFGVRLPTLAEPV
jgi:Rieske Fe-S protein